MLNVADGVVQFLRGIWKVFHFNETEFAASVELGKGRDLGEGT